MFALSIHVTLGMTYTLVSGIFRRANFIRLAWSGCETVSRRPKFFLPFGLWELVFFLFQLNSYFDLIKRITKTEIIVKSPWLWSQLRFEAKIQEENREKNPRNARVSPHSPRSAEALSSWPEFFSWVKSIQELVLNSKKGRRIFGWTATGCI